MHLQVILKATSACNGTCVYCSALATMESGSTLGQERFDELFGAFEDWLATDPARSLSFTWHGGEPMLPGLDWFREVAAAQARAFGPHVDRVHNRMQSNLALLTPEWFPFLTDFLGGSIGTSFDIVDGVRGLRSGASLGRAWIDAVRLCTRNGLGVGVVYVVHKRSLPLAREIYRFFRNVDPRLGLRINPLYREGRAAQDEAADLAVTPEEYGRFLCDICEHWWADRGLPSILPLKEWVKAWHGDPSRLCCDSGGQCQENHLGLAADGSAFGCGRASDAGSDDQRLGNIFEDPLDAILTHPGRLGLARRGPALLAGACGSCPHWPVCHGGCPQDAIIYYGDAMRETYFCSGRKMVFDLFERHYGPLRRTSAAGESPRGGRS